MTQSPTKLEIYRKFDLMKYIYTVTEEGKKKQTSSESLFYFKWKLISGAFCKYIIKKKNFFVLFFRNEKLLM